MNKRERNKLERDDIQGMLISAYGHLPWSAYLMLRIDDAARARGWLAALAPTITNGVGKNHVHGANVAITFSGLVELGHDPSAFPLAFVEGMASNRRAAILGDCDSCAPACWEWGTGAKMIDIALMFFAPASDALEVAVTTHRDGLAAAGLAEVVTLRAQRFPDGKEHFGFADGIAQPLRPGQHARKTRRGHRENVANEVPPGEFVLGYPNAYGYASESPALAGMNDFGRNGSYLVFRQLEQDVAKFWNFFEAQTQTAAGSDPPARKRLAAKFIGRWPSGAPLVKAPHFDNPALAGDNDFGFAGDPQGLCCPVGAHIRRANPRDGFAADRPADSLRRSNRHRILRRGRAYGPRINDIFTADGQPRGLHFICMCADIERQFEFVHQTWLNNITFSGLTNEVDPLVGAQPQLAGAQPPPAGAQPPRGGVMTIPGRPLRKRMGGLERFVTTKGGAYFFMPGLRALRFLATPP